jgi:hypothetical protein
MPDSDRRSHGIFTILLTATLRMTIVRHMNGLLAICGICPEIIG